ncbi:MAG: hypothetical protein Q8O95_01525 [bacterium]|nr:hypothetical protein [bacterium]
MGDLKRNEGWANPSSSASASAEKTPPGDLPVVRDGESCDVTAWRDRIENTIGGSEERTKLNISAQVDPLDAPTVMSKEGRNAEEIYGDQTDIKLGTLNNADQAKELEKNFMESDSLFGGDIKKLLKSFSAERVEQFIHEKCDEIAQKGKRIECVLEAPLTEIMRFIRREERIEVLEIKTDMVLDSHLKEIEGHPGIRSLNIHETAGGKTPENLSDVGLKSIAGLPNLGKLRLTNCKNITDQGISQLRGLSLVLLQLSSCSSLEGSGFSRLPASLRVLMVSGAQITHEAMELTRHLVNLEKLYVFSSLKLSGGEFGFLKSMRSLTELGFAMTDLSDADLPKMIDALLTADRNESGSWLKKLKGSGPIQTGHLKKIEMPAGVSPDGVALLKERLPEVRIECRNSSGRMNTSSGEIPAHRPAFRKRGQENTLLKALSAAGLLAFFLLAISLMKPKADSTSQLTAGDNAVLLPTPSENTPDLLKDRKSNEEVFRKKLDAILEQDTLEIALQKRFLEIFLADVTMTTELQGGVRAALMKECEEKHGELEQKEREAKAKKIEQYYLKECDEIDNNNLLFPVEKSRRYTELIKEMQREPDEVFRTTLLNFLRNKAEEKRVEHDKTIVEYITLPLGEGYDIRIHRSCQNYEPDDGVPIAKHFLEIYQCLIQLLGEQNKTLEMRKITFMYTAEFSGDLEYSVSNPNYTILKEKIRDGSFLVDMEQDAKRVVRFGCFHPRFLWKTIMQCEQEMNYSGSFLWEEGRAIAYSEQLMKRFPDLRPTLPAKDHIKWAELIEFHQVGLEPFNDQRLIEWLSQFGYERNFPAMFFEDGEFDSGDLNLSRILMGKLFSKLIDQDPEFFTKMDEALAKRLEEKRVEFLKEGTPENIRIVVPFEELIKIAEEVSPAFMYWKYKKVLEPAKVGADPSFLYGANGNCSILTAVWEDKEFKTRNGGKQRSSTLVPRTYRTTEKNGTRRERVFREGEAPIRNVKMWFERGNLLGIVHLDAKGEEVHMPMIFAREIESGD